MRIALLAAGLIGGAFPVVSQGPSLSFSQTLVVTASLEKESREELPAFVSIIEADQIDARQATSVHELLASLPGLTVTQSGTPGHQTSVFTRGTESDQTLVLWNGIPINDPFFGGFDWAFLSTDGVDRIEVTRGPFSTLYGSNAVGGVVQVLTGREPGVRLRLEGGQQSYARAGLAAAGDLGTFHWDVSGHHRRGEGQLDNDFFHGDGAVARTEWGLHPGTTVGILARYSNSSIGIPLSGEQPTPRRRSEWLSQQIAVPLTLEKGKWGLDALLSQVSTELAFEDPDALFSRNETEGRRLRGRAVGIYRPHDSLWSAFGGEWERQEVSNASNFGVNLDGDHQQSWAAFGEVHTAWKRLRVDLAVRREDNQIYGEQISPKLGVLLAVGGGTRIFANWGEGFRAPSLGELYFPFSGNPDLKPETSDSLELGLEHSFGGWTVGVVAFDNRLRNLIDFDFVRFTNVNVGRARSRGVEGEVALSGNWVSGRLNATSLRAEDLDSGEPLLRRPEESANLMVTLRPHAWSVNLTGRYVGERVDVDAANPLARVSLPGYLRLDLAAKWEAQRWISPYLRAENLLDKEYAEVDGIPAPGRTLIAGVALEL